MLSLELPPALPLCQPLQLPEGVQSASDVHGFDLTPEQRQQQLSRQASQQEALLRQVSRSSSLTGMRPQSQCSSQPALDQHGAAEEGGQQTPPLSPL